MEHKYLSRALQWHTYGINFYSVTTSLPRRPCPAVPTSAVTGTAEWIIQLLFDAWNGSWSVDAMYFSNTSKYPCGAAPPERRRYQEHRVRTAGPAVAMTHGIGPETPFWGSAASAIRPSCFGTARRYSVPRAGL